MSEGGDGGNTAAMDIPSYLGGGPVRDVDLRKVLEKHGLTTMYILGDEYVAVPNLEGGIRTYKIHRSQG